MNRNWAHIEWLSARRPYSKLGTKKDLKFEVSKAEVAFRACFSAYLLYHVHTRLSSTTICFYIVHFFYQGFCRVSFCIACGVFLAFWSAWVCDTMASLRKRLSKWTLGEQSSPSSNDINVEDSARASPKKLHKALSTTFNYLANTVRQGATYIYHEPETEGLSQNSDGGPPEETPKKHRRQVSFYASVRSRKHLSREQNNAVGSPSRFMTSSPNGQDCEARSPERQSIRTSESSDNAPTLVRSREASECPTLVCVNDETAPTLNVQLPESSWPIKPTIDVTSPSEITVHRLSLPFGNQTDGPLMEDPFISRDGLSPQLRNFLSLDCPNAKAQSGEDTGYVAESESGADQSGIDDFSPACLRYVAPGSPEAEASKACNRPHRSAHVHSTENCGSPVINPHRGSSASAVKPTSQSFVGIVQSPARQDLLRLPSEVYEADAELSETGPEVTPSMGSRTMFEHGLADRSRRYLAVIGHNTGSDNNTSTKGQCSRSSRVESLSLMLSKRLTDDDIMTLGTSDIEFQDIHLVSSNSDTDVSGSSPLRHTALLTQEDAYGAGLRAAGIVRSSSRQPSCTASEQAGCNLSNTGTKPEIFTPTGHWGSVSDHSDIKTHSCTVTTSDSSCKAPPPFPILQERSEPTRQSISAEGSALHATVKVKSPITGPANVDHDPSSPATPGEKVATNTPVSDSSPHRVFNAARLPSFGSPSNCSLPKSKRALRQQKKAKRKVAFTSPTEVDTMENASLRGGNPQPFFSVKHFEPTKGDPHPYAGHELDAVHNVLQPRTNCLPQVREVKVVSFAEKEEIVGTSVTVRRLSPASKPQ